MFRAKSCIKGLDKPLFCMYNAQTFYIWFDNIEDIWYKQDIWFEGYRKIWFGITNAIYKSVPLPTILHFTPL
jgi:hypothetical protein